MEKTKVVLKTIAKPKLASLPAWLIICLISLTVACRKEAAIEATPPSTVAQHGSDIRLYTDRYGAGHATTNGEWG